MTYLDKINSLSHFSMDDFIDISRKLLPNEYKSRPWEKINHGLSLLSTEEQLCAYIAAYGEMHLAKCKASFQNFNFESIKSNIEIIDWGCGQGIGSLTFIDMLKDRDMLYLLKRVTLIEPSNIALIRANINIQKATNGNIHIQPINKFLPGNGSNDEVEGIDYQQHNVIHIFSNILDIPTVNLEKLTNVVAVSGHTHYIMCMGPLNTNSYRIEKFCSAFNVSHDAYFSIINNPCYGHTSDTHHNFSCITRCFKYNGEGINTEKMESIVEPTLVCGRPIIDDYDPMLAVQNKLISVDLCNFYIYLSKSLNESDYFYLKPNINGDTPDIVIVRPRHGIVIINLFEDDINNFDFRRIPIGNEKYKIDSNYLFNINVDKEKSDNDNIYISSPIITVKSYQQNLIQLHIKDMLAKSLINYNYWSIIKTVVFFTKNPTIHVEDKFKEAKEKYTKLFGNDILDNKDFNFFKEINLNYPSRYFEDSICNSFIRIVSPKWHSYKQGIHINLTKIQESLSKSEPSPRRKINGVAGSGKTQVLAKRAVNAHLRTGNRILILTYNLTLVNYIKHRIGQIRADFFWDKFYVINYHQLFLTESNNHGLKKDLSSFQNTLFFEGVKDKINKYSTILIDEVQDYQTAWLNILEKNFLEPGGEIVVFGDAKQNIYQRMLDKNGQVRIGFIPGEWNNSLNKSFRFNNPQLTSLAINFQREFFPIENVDNIEENTLFDFDSCIKYYYVGNDIKPEVLDANCRWIMDEFGIVSKDVVILSQTCDILRDIEYSYRKATGHNAMTTFESKEQYEQLKSLYNIKDDKSPVSFKFTKDLKDIRRNMKIHFTMDTPIIKLSTIHSFKGWESSAVILILEPERNGDEMKYSVGPEENSAELIYTAITRCKEKLFIINCGNKKYHQFFSTFSNR